MSQLARVQEGLEEAHNASRRSGKWSTPTEVRHFEEVADLSKLRQLVKDGAAKEKIVKGTPTKLFKPTRAGAQMYGLQDDGKDKDRGPGDDDGKKPRRGGKHPKKPGRRDDGKKPGRRGGKPDRKHPPRPRKEPKKPTHPPKGPRRGGNVANNVGNTVGAGVATLLVGGMGSSIGGGRLPAGPRSGSIGYISGPM